MNLQLHAGDTLRTKEGQVGQRSLKCSFFGGVYLLFNLIILCGSLCIVQNYYILIYMGGKK